MEKVVSVNAQMAEYPWGRVVRQEHTKHAWRHAQVCNIIFSYYQNLKCLSLVHYTNKHNICIYFSIWWNRRKNESAIHWIDNLHTRAYDEKLGRFGVRLEYPSLDVYIIIQGTYQWWIRDKILITLTKLIFFCMISNAWNNTRNMTYLNLHPVIYDINLFMIKEKYL